MNLKQVFDNQTDKFTRKWEHYFEVYDRYLQRFVGKEFTLLEIGISNGGSLQMWKKYFGDKVKIAGIDIEPVTMFTESQIKTFCGKQADPNFLNKVLQEIGNPDVIIDDGSHDQSDVLTSMSMLFPILNENGVYIVEDTHTAYWQAWQGGINSPMNSVSVISRCAHDVNLQHIKEPYTPALLDLKSLSFYDSMIVLEKEKHTTRKPVEAGVNRVIPD